VILKELRRYVKLGWFGPELSACQVELKTPPCSSLTELRRCLERQVALLRFAASKHDLTVVFADVARIGMPLVVTKDATGRYQRIARELGPQRLRAACRTAGLHVHIGMPDHETALRVYNAMVPFVGTYEQLGDRSGGERLRLYRQVQPDASPRQFDSWDQLYAFALHNGFVDNLRNWWWLMRLTRYGTFENRCAGSLSTIDAVMAYVARSLEDCKRGMKS
jgi:carboxylate-amine ligase